MIRIDSILRAYWFTFILDKFIILDYFGSSWRGVKALKKMPQVPVNPGYSSPRFNYEGK